MPVPKTAAARMILEGTICRYLTSERTLDELRAFAAGLSATGLIDESTPLPPAIRADVPTREDIVALGTRVMELATDGKIEEARLVASRLTALDEHAARAAYGVINLVKTKPAIPPRAKTLIRPTAPPAWLMQTQVDEMTDLAGHPRLKPGTPAHRVMSEGTGPSDADHEETRR